MHWRQWDLKHMVVRVYGFVISEIKPLNLNLGGWGARMSMVFLCSGCFIGFGKLWPWTWPWKLVKSRVCSNAPERSHVNATSALQPRH